MGLFNTSTQSRALDLGVAPTLNSHLGNDGAGAFSLPGGTTTITAGDDQNATVNTTNNVNFELIDLNAIAQAFGFASASQSEAFELVGDSTRDAFNLVEDSTQDVLNLADTLSADARDNLDNTLDFARDSLDLADAGLDRGFDLVEFLGDVVRDMFQDTIEAGQGATDTSLAAIDLTRDALDQVTVAYDDAGQLILAASEDANDVTRHAINEVSNAHADAGELILAGTNTSIRAVEETAANAIDANERVAVATQLNALNFLDDRLADQDAALMQQIEINRDISLTASQAITDNLKTSLAFVRQENAGESGLVVDVVKYVGLASVGIAIAWGASRAFAK